MATLSRQQLLQKLKLPANASLEDVKRAYRYHAKRLHPDKNPSQDTTQAFQQLQQAYRQLLKDYQQPPSANNTTTSTANINEQVKRNQDQLAKAYGFKPTNTPHNSLRKTQKLSPNSDIAKTIQCQRCGQCKTSLCKRQFLQVIGLLYRSKQRQYEGIWCLNCSWQLSLRYNCINLVLGWWSLPTGPLRTLKALWHNVKGGYQPENQQKLLLALVKLLYQQHHYGEAVNYAYQLLSLTPKPNQQVQQTCLKLLDNLGNPLKPKLPNLVPWYWPASHSGLAILFFLLVTIPFFIGKLFHEPFLPAEPFKIRPIPLYTSERLGIHYTLVETKLYDSPSPTSQVIQLLPAYQSIKVNRVVNQSWLQVTYNDNKRLFVREAFIGFGDAYTAKKLKCNQYPQHKPFNGELMGMQFGQQSIALTNYFNEDAIVTFYSGKQLVQKVIVYANSTAQLNHLPSGINRLNASFGKFFNQACGGFTLITSKIRQNITLFTKRAELSLKPASK